MSVNELGQLFPIIIQDYREEWIELYELEKQLILDRFDSSEIVRIDHIGSTAIPGMKAKPTVDILLQVARQIEISKVKFVFTSLNYHINEHPDNPPPHLTFVKGYSEQGFKGQAYHVHIRYRGDWNEIRFRDYLISHKTIAKEYQNLKLRLAAKYRHDREAYTNLKSDFIGRINKLAR